MFQFSKLTYKCLNLFDIKGLLQQASLVGVERGSYDTNSTFSSLAELVNIVCTNYNKLQRTTTND